MSQTQKKLDVIYQSTLKKKKKSRLLRILAYVFLGVMLSSGSLSTVYTKEGQPFWNQPLVAQILIALMFTSVIMIFVLMQYTTTVSFEKDIFLKIYDAYGCLMKYNSLSGSVSQERTDLDKTLNLTHKVSSLLLARKNKSSLLDIGKEVNTTYFELGKMLQTRILPNLQKESELVQMEEKLLALAEVFADISF